MSCETHRYLTDHKDTMPLTVDFGNGTFESSSLSSDCAAAATGSAVRWGSIPTVWNLINDHATYNPLSDDFI